MKKFNLNSLVTIIEKRIKEMDITSYTYKLYNNPKLLNKKILEEARELTKTKNKSQVIWEASDLLYFILVFLVRRKVSLNSIENKLIQRNIIKLRKRKTKLKRGQNGRF